MGDCCVGECPCIIIIPPPAAEPWEDVDPLDKERVKGPGVKPAKALRLPEEEFGEERDVVRARRLERGL